MTLPDHSATLRCCRLCPWQCSVNREAGKRGFCRSGTTPVIFRFGSHDGEEPPVSGTGGSGTIFFSRCTLRCIYCQNYPWSQLGKGTEYDHAGLVEILESLREAGCHNWNLVSPTPWLPMIRSAWQQACETGPALPVVYNTSGYERVETVADYADMVDIYLSDLRYAKDTTAEEGSGTRDYVTASRAALRAMWQRTGPLQCDENGIAISGTICRLLILPGHASEAVDNLEWIARELGTAMPVSVMAQYEPLYQATERGAWGNPITREEYDTVCDTVDRLGFETGWIQEFGKPPPKDLLGHTMPAGNGTE